MGAAYNHEPHQNRGNWFQITWYSNDCFVNPFHGNGLPWSSPNMAFSVTVGSDDQTQETSVPSNISQPTTTSAALTCMPHQVWRPTIFFLQPAFCWREWQHPNLGRNTSHKQLEMTHESIELYNSNKHSVRDIWLAHPTAKLRSPVVSGHS